MFSVDTDQLVVAGRRLGGIAAVLQEQVPPANPGVGILGGGLLVGAYGSYGEKMRSHVLDVGKRCKQTSETLADSAQHTEEVEKYLEGVFK